MKLRIDGAEERTDGSGMTALDVWALDNSNGVIPGMHRTVLLDSKAVNAALALGTAAQRAVALKGLITTEVQEMANAALVTRVAANEASAAAASALKLAYTFPLTITL